MLSIEALDTNRQTIDAGGAVVREFGLLEGAGVGLERYFNVSSEGQMCV